MIDYEARKIIEALRSGVPSRAVGQYFSSARPEIMAQISKNAFSHDYNLGFRLFNAENRSF